MTDEQNRPAVGAPLDGPVGRVRTVEYDPGWGWIARSPFTGAEIPEPGFRWFSRESARCVVAECRMLRKAPNAISANT